MHQSEDEQAVFFIVAGQFIRDWDVEREASTFCAERRGASDTRRMFFITVGPMKKLFAWGVGPVEEPGTLTQGEPVFPGSSRLGIEPKEGVSQYNVGVTSLHQTPAPTTPTPNPKRNAE